MNLNNSDEENFSIVSNILENSSDESLIFRCKECPLIPYLGINFLYNQVNLEYICDKGHNKMEEISSYIENYQPIFSALCSQCQQKQKNNNFYYCFHCYKYYCKNCLNQHEKNSVIFIPLNQIDSLCDKHGNKFISYCFTCKKNICEICNLNKYHIEHKQELIENLKIHKKEIKKNYRNKIKEYENKINLIEEIKNKIVFEYEERINKINKYFKIFKENNIKELLILNNLLNTYETNYHQLNYQIIYNIKNIFHFNELNLPSFEENNIFENENKLLEILKNFNILKESKIKEFPEIILETPKNLKKINNEEKTEKHLKINNTFNVTHNFFSKFTIQNNNSNNLFNSNPNNLKLLKEIADNANVLKINHPNLFTVFISTKNEPLLIYINNLNNSLYIYDLEKNKNIKIIKNAHNNSILCIRYFYDILLKRDLIITSSFDNSIKVFDLSNNYQNILTIKNAHENSDSYKNFWINSICLVLIENKMYVLSCCNDDNHLKLWEFNGNLKKNYIECKYVNFINIYYDKNKNKNFVVLCGNFINCFSYTFKSGKFYRKYKNFNESEHKFILVNEIKDKSYLINCADNGYITIFNFHSGENLKEIFIGFDVEICGILLWNENNILCVANDDKNIFLYDKKNDKINVLYENSCNLIYLEKIKILEEEFLLFQDSEGKIKMMNINNNN